MYLMYLFLQQALVLDVNCLTKRADDQQLRKLGLIGLPFL